MPNLKTFEALIIPAESSLKEKVLAIDEEKERIAREQEQQETERLQARVKLIDATGAKFDGVNYNLMKLQLSLAELKLMDNETFNSHYEQFKTLAGVIESQRKEAETAQREAEEQERQSLQAVTERLQHQQAENERLQNERTELLKQRTAAREKQLQELGMTLDFAAGLWHYKTKDFGYVAIHTQDVVTIVDEWAAQFAFAASKIDDIKQKQAEFDAKQAEQPVSLTKENEASQEADIVGEPEMNALERDFQKALPWLKELHALFLRVPQFETDDLKQATQDICEMQSDILGLIKAAEESIN